MTEYHHNGAVYRSYRYGWGAIHRAVTMSEERRPLAEIADATGIKQGTLTRVRRVLCLKDGARVAQLRRYSRENGRDYAALHAEAVRLHDRGASQREIHEALGISYHSIRGALRNAGRRPRSKSAACRLAWANGRRSRPTNPAPSNP